MLDEQFKEFNETNKYVYNYPGREGKWDCKLTGTQSLKRLLSYSFTLKIWVMSKL